MSHESSSPENRSHKARTLLGFLGRRSVSGNEDNIAQPEGRPLQRKSQLDNSLIINGAGGSLICPDREVTSRIAMETNGKVTYFPVPDREGFIASKDARIGQIGYAEHITDPLTVEVTTRFPGKRLAMRAVATSINGHFAGHDENQGELWDVTETVSRGTEKPGTSFNVAVLNSERPLSIHRVNQYASYVGLDRAFEEDAEKADAMFPAMLVYDADLLKGDGSGRAYGATFAEGAKPDEALLAAYILDCPNDK